MNYSETVNDSRIRYIVTKSRTEMLMPFIETSMTKKYVSTSSALNVSEEHVIPIH